MIIGAFGLILMVLIYRIHRLEKVQEETQRLIYEAFVEPCDDETCDHKCEG